MPLALENQVLSLKILIAEISNRAPRASFLELHLVKEWIRKLPE